MKTSVRNCLAVLILLAGFQVSVWAQGRESAYNKVQSLPPNARVLIPEQLSHPNLSTVQRQGSMEHIQNSPAWAGKIDPLFFRPVGSGKSEGALSKVRLLEGEGAVLLNSFVEDGNRWFTGFIQILPGTNPDLLPGLRPRLISPNGNIVMGDFRQDHLFELAREQNVLKIQPSHIRPPAHKTSRGMVSVDAVHQGTELPMPMKGEGVIVGVIDSGIDFSNPDFSNALGTRLLYLA